MLKIDWKQISYDYVWFGWYIDWTPSPWHVNRVLVWKWAGNWCECLWPVRRYGEGPPGWWLWLFGRYVKD